jgi:hypothetical protein
MKVIDAALEAIQIYNMGINQALHFATYPNNNGNRLIITLEGTKERINALIERIKEEDNKEK